MQPATRRLTITAILLYIVAYLLTIVLHEVAHAVMALALGDHPILYNTSVQNTNRQLSNAAHILIAAAGPIFSLLQGLTLLLLVRRSHNTSPSALFWLYMSAFGLINFFGYLMIAPFAKGADTGQIMARLHVAAVGQWAIAAAGLGCLLLLMSSMAPLFLRHLPTEMQAAPTPRANGMRALLLWPWLVGSVVLVLLALPAPHPAVIANMFMSPMVLSRTYRRALASPVAATTVTGQLGSPWALALAVLVLAVGFKLLGWGMAWYADGRRRVSTVAPFFVRPLFRCLMTDYSAFFIATQQASRALAAVAPATIDALLRDLADATVAHTDFLLAENAKDLARMPATDPRYDRLRLTPERLQGMAQDLHNVAALPSPLSAVLSEQTLPNGLQLSKVRVPLGVVGIIYEARPNVTFDSLAICLKTGNACLLKGGSDAADSNAALLAVAGPVLTQHGVPLAAVTLLPPERAATEAMLTAVGYVDVVIPRGSQGLIDFVRKNARVPVIETGAGVVHTYFDETGDLGKGRAIVANAKTRRVSVCNSLDCLLLNEHRLADLPALLAPLTEARVQVFADAPAYAALAGTYPAELLAEATEAHFGTEFLDYKLAVKTVPDLAAALDHIARHGSRHSEAIVSEDEAHIDRFLRLVDAAAVYANASTAFTDGAQFGLGAEIGISTQKLHARGPMGLAELTSYKWLVRGTGQVRQS